MLRGRTLALFLALSTLLVLQGCSWGSGGNRPAFSGGYSNDGPGRPPKEKELRDAKPKWEPRTRAGNAPKYTVLGQTYYTLQTAEGYRRRGIASWYGRKFHGRNTANGERYDMYSMSAAHKTLPIPSYVRVRNLNNGREAIVRVNDRGPFIDAREIDLSYAAAVKLGVFNTGTAPVEVVGIEVTRSGRKIDPGYSQAQTQAPTTPSPAAESLAAIHRDTPAAATEAYIENTAPATPTAPQFQAQPIAEPIPKPKPKPKPVVTATAFGPQWWVQAGAFNDIAGAESFSSRLQAEGFPNTVVNTQQANWAYKVRIGPFQMETHARWAQLSLEEKGLNKGFVVNTAQP